MSRSFHKPWSFIITYITFKVDTIPARSKNLGLTSCPARILLKKKKEGGPFMISDPNIQRADLRVWVHSGVDTGVDQNGHKTFLWGPEPVWLLPRFFHSPEGWSQAIFWTAGEWHSLGHFSPEVHLMVRFSLERHHWGKSLRARCGFSHPWISSAPG